LLYLVGTPIGNTGDMSPRACEILANADIVACEDTRVTGLLLKDLGINAKKLFSYHEHNKAAAGPKLIEELAGGASVALVSDAGMPAISDPGQDLVKLAIEAGIEVTAVPGPIAAATALVLSGLPTTIWHFEGFFPSSGSARNERLERIKTLDGIIVIYEAPHRLLKLLSELESAGLADRRLAACRELTKKYEEVVRGTVTEVRAHFETTAPKGEFVLCLEGSAGGRSAAASGDWTELAAFLKSSGMKVKDISKAVSIAYGLPKNEVYDSLINQ